MHSSLIKLGFLFLLLQVSLSHAQLSPSFYDKTCPQVFDIATKTIVNALRSDPRIAASILRLHFHDCFVNGCDASILLDNTTSFRTEKDAFGNANSARGFDVIDKMKAAVEKACPKTVSCADLLAIAAQESVVLAGGPSWRVPNGRRDSLRGFMDLANNNLPGPSSTLKVLKDRFKNVGLDRPSDLVALSGGHTFGKSQCQFIMDRLYNFSNTGLPDPTLDKSYLTTLRKQCPRNGNQRVLVDFDLRTPTLFDNKYYVNLKENKGLIQSDQELFSSPDASDTLPLVREYADGQGKFFDAFAKAMIRMSSLSPLTGKQGEIRLNCRVVNSKPRIMDVVEDAIEFASSM
ncbi:hem peroxidase [Arabidopsis thaliana x Arabidopsis arenosa]|uniref:peroxidase n=1 Tax=Arabidopsis thaliana x Arabidopsis arenosa TaxID=1240361 RepID=A0A8T1Z0U2_9BRAS|nr:hem peroxidase [Arabidopsis thaliana x Arabidopsis arenosa]